MYLFPVSEWWIIWGREGGGKEKKKRVYLRMASQGLLSRRPPSVKGRRRWLGPDGGVRSSGCWCSLLARGGGVGLWSGGWPFLFLFFLSFSLSLHFLSLDSISALFDVG